MARVAIAINQLKGSKNPANPGADASFTLADATNDHEWVFAPRDMLMLWNGAGSQTVTLKSVADPFGRVLDEVISVGASQIRVIGPLDATGWAQTDGKIYIDTAAPSTLLLAVLRQPSN